MSPVNLDNQNTTESESKGADLAPHQIIIRPLLTEKSVHRSTEYNQYAFEVNMLATKTDIRQAVEDLFNVKVEKVRIQNRKGKPRRTRTGMSKTRSWRKALVTLTDEHRIDFF